MKMYMTFLKSQFDWFVNLKRKKKILKVEFQLHFIYFITFPFFCPVYRFTQVS